MQETERINLKNFIVQGITRDSSAWFLILSNVTTIILAALQGWNAATILWTYWLQSVIIGLFHAARIAGLKKVSTEGLKFNGKPAEPSPGIQKTMGMVFTFHYGLFHLVYAIFLTAVLDKVNYSALVQGGLLFLLTHGYSYYRNKKELEENEHNLGTFVMRPYPRILPMHLTLLFCLFFLSSTFSLVVFLMLKTVTDVIMHVVEHAKMPVPKAFRLHWTKPQNS